MGKTICSSGLGPMPFDSAAMFGETNAERLRRWQQTFHRLGAAIAELPANDDLEDMIRRLDGVPAKKAG